eukprot:m.39860 g.39860  ORF g.39860 m.39860 type:complete len:458 (+) comp12706_c0_seq1:59-1432(+)
MANVTETHVALPKVKFSVTSSHGKGPTVVLLHDAMRSSKCFNNHLEGALGKQLRLVAIDLPGHGRSSNANDAGVYTIQRLAKQLQVCLQELQLGQILLVGVGYSAHLALATASLHTAVSGVLMVGAVPGRLTALPDISGPDADAARVDENFIKMRQVDVQQGAAQRDLQYIDALGSRASLGLVHGVQDLASVAAAFESVHLPRFWRGALQVLPGTTATLTAAIDPLSRVLRDFVRDVTGSIGPVERVASAASPNQTAGVSGQIPHPASRFEAPVEAAAGSSTDRYAVDEGHKNNPYAKGRLPSGRVPHPNMRFETPSEESTAVTAPVKQPTDNPYVRGRIKGGIMPHPSSRFEGQPEPEPERRKSTVDPAKNPYARGRIRGGVMPHPGSRFEAEVVSTEHVPTTAAVGPQAANPYARGRLPAGQVPHPSARFEHHPIDHPSTKVVQPPGGHTSNIFG